MSDSLLETPPAAPNPAPSGDAPITPPPTPPEQTGILNTDGTFSENWLDRLPADLADAKPTLGKFKSFGDMAKSYVSLQTTLGKKANAFTVPNEKSTPEEIAAYRKALGVPDKPEDYGLKPEKLPDGVTFDEELAKGFSEIAHKYNVPASAMKALTERYLATEQARAQEMELAAKSELDKARGELQKEFGGNFDANIQLATRMAKTLGVDPATPGLRDPSMVKALVRMAGMISEDKLAGIQATATPGGMNAKDIMTNPQNPYYDRYQKGDPEVAKMVNDLMRQQG